MLQNTNQGGKFYIKSKMKTLKNYTYLTITGQGIRLQS